MGLTMRMATFVLDYPERLPPADEEVLRDVIWAHTQCQDQVEHIRVRAGPDRISVALFLLAPDQLTAEEVARDISSRIRVLPTFNR